MMFAASCLVEHPSDKHVQWLYLGVVRCLTSANQRRGDDVGHRTSVLGVNDRGHIVVSRREDCHCGLADCSVQTIKLGKRDIAKRAGTATGICAYYTRIFYGRPLAGT
jgi:hypothetical protein